jgi:hypothetical protein
MGVQPGMLHAMLCTNGRRAAAGALALLGTLAGSADAMAFDRDRYDALLARHTRAVDDVAGTRVDYAGLRADPAWRSLVASLDAVDPGALASREARLAFWIDVYNVLAVDWLVRKGPVESIRDLGNPLWPVWRRTAGRVGGHEVSLHEVEHEILRPMGEPRIHFAIVCASTSCPSLRREAWRPGALERQLEEATRAFLADPRKGLAIDRAEAELRVSKILDWFADDFGGDAGVVAFLAEHAPEADRAWIAEHADALDLESLPYDWTVNALEGRR